jgi:predicted tellurium resistance membrane protein TerC
MGWLSDPGVWASLVTLTALEIVLGIDNLVFIAVLAGRLPSEQRRRARRIGLVLALISRLALLASIVWVIRFSRPLFDLFGHAVSLRDIVLTGGGLFLLYKGTREIHRALEGDRPALDRGTTAPASFAGTVVQIMLLDIVFSLDSVITAVGMANKLWIMAAAIVIAVAIMLWGSGPLADFVERHPTVKMLALSFLMLIGMTLVADGAGFHVPKGYIYAAIVFSVMVEALNQFATRRRRAHGHNAGLASGRPAAAGGGGKATGSTARCDCRPQIDHGAAIDDRN